MRGRVSLPTLSAQVRELEGFLGRPLFLREGRSLVLTDTDRVVRRYAERIFAFGDEMVEVVRRGAPSGLETVYLGVVDAGITVPARGGPMAGRGRACVR